VCSAHGVHPAFTPQRIVIIIQGEQMPSCEQLECIWIICRQCLPKQGMQVCDQDALQFGRRRMADHRILQCPEQLHTGQG
jgi:hypothetical protein